MPLLANLLTLIVFWVITLEEVLVSQHSLDDFLHNRARLGVEGPTLYNLRGTRTLSQGAPHSAQVVMTVHM